jgi:hypothetical protein
MIDYSCYSFYDVSMLKLRECKIDFLLIWLGHFEKKWKESEAEIIKPTFSPWLDKNLISETRTKLLWIEHTSIFQSLIEKPNWNSLLVPLFLLTTPLFQMKFQFVRPIDLISRDWQRRSVKGLWVAVLNEGKGSFCVQFKLERFRIRNRIFVLRRVFLTFDCARLALISCPGHYGRELYLSMQFPISDALDSPLRSLACWQSHHGWFAFLWSRKK